MTVILADKQFMEYYNIDENRSGLVATIPWAMTALAQLWLGGTLASWLGRLWALQIVVEVVPNNFGVLILGRLVTGLGFGCVYIATNLYVAECAPTKLRGSFVGTVAQFGYQLGSLIAFWTGYGMSFHKSPYNIAWRVSNIVQIPIGLAFVAISFWYPESPRFVLEKYPETPERALKVLSRLRSGAPTDERIRTEFHELVASYEFRRRYETGYVGLLKDKTMRKRLWYDLYAAGLQQRSVEKFGRRGLLLAGFAIQSLALLIMSCLTTAFPSKGNKAAAIVEIAMLFIVGLTYCWSIGPIAPTVVTEIFPRHVRDKGFGLSMLGQTCWLILLTQSWPSFNNKVGDHSYWLLFGLNLAAGISVYFILPETKGVSLERMDKIFEGPDNVEAGEFEGTSEKREAMAVMDKGDKAPTAYVEDASPARSSQGPERSSV
ncbi:hypothetical protein PENANT_c012G03554 [Penicillium antarcticum]|uniref:Major facilitator superfamily (MFS) profile domain-containing protein n=1 Tax=Penicillium antarcticum TaxID=416450 RepID=A0A1V6Q5R2_9EURO|nr:hypothetical protein PENANT_c012G03554 [Penicillium antarcticum]